VGRSASLRSQLFKEVSDRRRESHLRRACGPVRHSQARRCVRGTRYPS
jgi:hypothetical protein